MILAVLLLTGALSTARADAPSGPVQVISVGLTPKDVKSQVAAATSSPESALQPNDLHTYQKDFPVSLVGGGEGSIAGCPAGSRATHVDDIAAFIPKVREEEISGDYKTVGITGLTLDQTLACLGEQLTPAAARDAAEAYLRIGAGASNVRDPVSARLAFQVSLALNPEQRWPETGLDTDEDGGDLFRAMAPPHQAPPTVTLGLIAPGVTLSVDGGSEETGSSISVPAGRHLLQLHGASGAPRSYWISLKVGTAPSLVVPDAIPDSALDWVHDPVARVDLAAVLAGWLGQGVSIYVVTSQREVWRGTTGEDGWTKIAAIHRTARVLARVGEVSMLTGAAVAVIGGITLGAGCAVGHSNDPNDRSCGYGPDGPDPSPGFQTYEAGWYMALGGVGVLGSGALLYLGSHLDMTLGLTPLPGLHGLALTLSPASGGR